MLVWSLHFTWCGNQFDFDCPHHGTDPEVQGVCHLIFNPYTAKSVLLECLVTVIGNEMSVYQNLKMVSLELLKI